MTSYDLRIPTVDMADQDRRSSSGRKPLRNIANSTHVQSTRQACSVYPCLSKMPRLLELCALVFDRHKSLSCGDHDGVVVRGIQPRHDAKATRRRRESLGVNTTRFIWFYLYLGHSRRLFKKISSWSCRMLYKLYRMNWSMWLYLIIVAETSALQSATEICVWLRIDATKRHDKGNVGAICPQYGISTMLFYWGILREILRWYDGNKP